MHTGRLMWAACMCLVVKPVRGGSGGESARREAGQGFRGGLTLRQAGHVRCFATGGCVDMVIAQDAVLC